MKKSLTLGVLLMAPLMAAHAAGPDFSYLQAEYILYGEVDVSGDSSGGLPTGGADYDGARISGSLGITDHLFAAGEYNDLHAKDSGSTGDYYSIGLGLHKAVIEGGNIDFYGLVTYDGIDLATYQGKGFGVTGGARWQVNDAFELAGHVGYVDYGSLDGLKADLDGIRFGVGAVYNLTDLFAVTLDYQTCKLDATGSGGHANYDLNNQVNIGIRLYPFQ